MIVLRVGADARTPRRFAVFPRWGRSGKLQIITCAYWLKTGSCASPQPVPHHLALSRSLGFLRRQIHRRAVGRLLPLAALSGVEPVPLYTFDKLNFQQFAF